MECSYYVLLTHQLFLQQVTTTAQKPPTGGLTRSKPGTSGSPNLYSIESFRKHGPKSPSTTVTKSIIRSESGSVGAGQGVKPIALKPVLVKEQIQVRNEIKRQNILPTVV